MDCFESGVESCGNCDPKKLSLHVCVWRLRNHKEVQTLCEEMSGIYDQQTLLEMYRAATADAYSFLFIRLDAKTRETMFYLRFEQRLVPEDVGEE